MNGLKPLDPVIHTPMRLSIMTILVSVREADFSYLKEATGASDGNLSTHLSRLEEAGYVSISKRFVGKKPRTTCSVTPEGRTAYGNYILSLEKYIRRPNANATGMRDDDPASSR